MLKFIASIALATLLCACTSLLPTAHTDSTSLENFDAARCAVEALIPIQSDKTTMAKNGFDPLTHPNTKILTHADVVRLLLPTSLLKRVDLDPGILMCLQARDKCHGMEITGAKISRLRTGNCFADFSNFSRDTETKGWRFTALILFVDELIVYQS
jgi:hypothetical protein